MTRVLVLGGYGLIGAALVRALAARGHAVVASGRSAASAATVLPGVAFRRADLGGAVDWPALLDGIDVVVNAAGALQDGARDDLQAVHHTAIAGLVAALGERRLVQISAPGAAPDDPSAFLATKGRGDAAVRGAADWVILRPGLVIGPQAYGGTALLRMLAAMPVATPMVHGGAQVQCIGLDDLAKVVVEAVEGRVPSGTVADLVEPEPHALRDVIAAFRRWLGYPPARWAPDLPGWIGRLAGRKADALGWLGWRSPLRTTALRQIERGVTGNAADWPGLKPLPEILAAMPATVQERRFARGMLMLPVAVGMLALFWLLSGIIALLRVPEAASVLDGVLSPTPATAFVIGGAFADIALGIGVMFRRWARPACLGMVALTFAYLAAGTVLTPWLWADPLGPFVKTLPAAVLALVTWAMLEER